MNPSLHSGPPAMATGAPAPLARPTAPGWTASLWRSALLDSLVKLNPAAQWRNPVMFVVYVGALCTTALGCLAAAGHGEPGARPATVLALAAWLWFTVIFANFAEAVAEGRGKQQAAALRGLRSATQARVLRRFDDGDARGGLAPGGDAPAWARDAEIRASTDLRKGDAVLVLAGEVVPGDGQAVAGIASVDESAMTGESAPVIRGAGGDFSSVTGGTRVLSDWLVVRIGADPGEGFLDRMISMVEGARRRKTPNELALTIVLAGLTLVLLVAVATLVPFSLYAAGADGGAVSLAALIALLVCLIPTTIGGLLSAIGVAGMSRMMRANVIATSGRAIEAAGDVDVLLLDKTGTITYGNRQAAAFLPAPGVTAETLGRAACLASMADDTPEGRSIVALARRHGWAAEPAAGAQAIAFSAQTRMSGVDLPQRALRKGAQDAVDAWLAARGQTLPAAVREDAEAVARRGSTPLVVCENDRALGVVELKDIVKPGMRERFAALRRMGIETVMITGDNPLTAAAIAAEAGVDDFLAQATPEAKLERIRAEQRRGRLVAMTGDGTNDAPALAQADVAVAMNSGTQAAKEASNLVDLDSDPTKLIEIVEIGKQMLMTRGALTTFSFANDLAKYFAIIPAAFAGIYPQLGALDVMRLGSPDSAVLSAVIFNALIIVALIPLALRGVRYRPIGAARLLRRNGLIYGVGGMLLPFAGIKLIDMVLALPGLA